MILKSWENNGREETDLAPPQDIDWPWYQPASCRLTRFLQIVKGNCFVELPNYAIGDVYIVCIDISTPEWWH